MSKPPPESIYNEVFISYSRENTEFAKKIVQAIHDAGRDGVWIDWEGIPTGANWFQEIQAGIDAADNFIFILTPDSILSKPCHNEIEHAVQANKRIIPINHIEISEEDFELIHPIISQHNWLKFKEEDDFDEGMKQLIQTIETDLEHVRSHTRLQTRAREWEIKRNADYLLSGWALTEAFSWLKNTRNLNTRPLATSLQRKYIKASKIVEEQRKTQEAKIIRRVQNFQRASIGLGITTLIAFIAALIAVNLIFEANTRSEQADNHVIEVETQVADRLIEADLQVAQAQGQSAGPLAQADAQIARAETQVAEQIAYAATEIAYADSQLMTEVAQLSDWQPVIQTFNCEQGYCVDMVLVPPGCFKMGNDVGDNDEKPVHSQCISQAFWIDRYEVSNEQFDILDGQAEYDGFLSDSLQPRSSISWFEALDFCILRGGTLPTEAQWEYAARGRDNLIYPWGNQFIGDNLAFEQTANDEPSIVGSYPRGASWVGAMDMLGNVWEWTSTIENPVAFFYPYLSDDGREDLEDENALRVLRGGSFVDTPDILYAANRGNSAPTIAHSNNGFRCVVSVP